MLAALSVGTPRTLPGTCMRGDPQDPAWHLPAWGRGTGKWQVGFCSSAARFMCPQPSQDTPTTSLPVWPRSQEEKPLSGPSLGRFLPQQGWGKGSFPALINPFLEKVLSIAPLSSPESSGDRIPTEPRGCPGFTRADAPGDGTAAVSPAVPCV